MGDFSRVLPTSPRGDHAGKLIESAVDCFYKIIFYWFTGAMNNKFLTNQNARSISVISEWKALHKKYVLRHKTTSHLLSLIILKRN